MSKTSAEQSESKKKRRGHGEGGIYQRESDGKWVGAVNLGYVDGKRKRKVVYGDTRKEVADKLKPLLTQQQQNLPIPTGRLSVADFLTGLWPFGSGTWKEGPPSVG